MAARKPGRFAMPRIGGPLPEAEGPRRPGPMAAAGRDSAEALTRLAEEQAEARRRNADDADAWRSAQADGRVLRRLPLAAVDAASLPRDRLGLDAVAQADAMEELKASIRERGQREPIEVWEEAGEDGAPVFRLATGWRRLEALRQLHAETGEDRFAAVLARVAPAAPRAARYLAMVEENAVREDVSFAEMAHVALAMARDPEAGVADAGEAVNRLYAALHKVKRSNIRRFVELLEAAGDLLPAPQEIPKNLGAEAARAIQADPRALAALRAGLRGAQDAAAQNAALAEAVRGRPAAIAAPGRTVAPGATLRVATSAGELRVTARDGELRLRGAVDFAGLPRERLAAAVAALGAALEE